MRKLMIAIATVLALLPQTAIASFSVEDLKGQCAASGDWCAGYVQAIMDTSKRRMCPPWGSGPHPTAPFAAVQERLQKRFTPTEPAARFVEAALAEAFACKR